MLIAVLSARNDVAARTRSPVVEIIVPLAWKEAMLHADSFDALFPVGSDGRRRFGIALLSFSAGLDAPRIITRSMQRP